MLLTNAQLTDTQLNALDQLMLEAQSVDKGLPAFYLHFLNVKRDTESNFLFYQNKHLIGFLSIYFFYEDACEISLLIHPDYRKQGIAHRLLKSAMPLIKSRAIPKLLFSTSASFSNTWQPPAGSSYQHSEYHMERKSLQPIPMQNASLLIRQANLADLNLLVNMDAACFNPQNINMHERLIYLLNNPDYTIFIAHDKNAAIGKAHIYWQKDRTMLSDIAIFPAFQGKGLGSELLAYCINHALGVSGNIPLALDVEASNQHALNLYLRHGFSTTNQYDFWSISSEKLQSMLTL